jgi:hypothetical protein
VIKSRRMRWAGHVERTRAIKDAYRISKNLKGIDNFQDIFVDGSIILNWILEKQSGKLDKIRLAKNRYQ